MLLIQEFHMLANSTLIYGPQGCGKTLLAKFYFTEAQQQDKAWTTVELKASEVLQDPDVGLKKVFQAVERFHIQGLLIEDIDNLLSDLRNHLGARRYLLDQIKQVTKGQLIIATARKPEALKPEELAVFDDILPVLYPDLAERIQILQVHTRNVIMDSSVNLEEIARLTEWWSGAELEELIAQSQPNGAGVLSNNLLTQGIEAIAQRVIPEHRVERMRELLRFTDMHCAQNKIRSDVLTRFSAILDQLEAATSVCQIEEIEDVLLREEIDRALKNITIENVDLGLFQLAKIFENELKAFLLAAQRSGSFNVARNDLQRLATMIDAVVRIGVVKKEHHLTLLREQRNERAHGRIPDLAERERLLQHAPFLRDLYIEYIVFFRRERNKLDKKAT